MEQGPDELPDRPEEREKDLEKIVGEPTSPAPPDAAEPESQPADERGRGINDE